ncbi:CIC11C00000000537 [Sungouiella intermedia]|uniref:CIC11C00000000537 n=1 Tax=Sungouiella intermedia TaxID=45354 RepID=A0A1L0BRK8_9ASCO|nr:CIC11C00000000537 [[Candida] intermedia]
MSFGHGFKTKYFPISDNSYNPVNHGSYGLPPQCVIDKYYKEFCADLASPDTYALTIQPDSYAASLKAVAKFLNCSYKRLAFVDNATTGVNCVLRSYPFKKGDKIVMPSTTYGACANTVRFLEQKIGIEVVVVDLVFPLTDAEVVAAFKKAFDENTVTLALFDTVVSMPGVKLPFKELVKLCKEYGVLSLVDGAHSIGLLPMDFADFEPDYYVSNLHKWLGLPRGNAVLYVDPKHFRTIQTMPISHSYVSTDAELTAEELDNLLVTKFTFTGSKCYASVAAIEEAIRFRAEECGGEDAIRKYCFGLAREVGEMAEKKWPGLKIIENEEKSLATAMITAYVPMEDYSKSFDASNLVAAKAFIKFAPQYQIKNYKSYLPFAVHGGKIVVRFSCQVYNELSDYEYAIEVVQKTIEAFFLSEFDKLSL